MNWINAFIVALSLLLLLPVAWLTLQVLLGIKIKKPVLSPVVSQALDYVVLIPAHNEEQVIEACLTALSSAMSGNGRIVVIADNCTDRTAELARQHGVLVLERENKIERGKSYAIAFGVEHLRTNAPDVVIVLDADTKFYRGTPFALAQKAIQKNRPIQSLYIMKAPIDAALTVRIAAFAWLVKNRLRTVATPRLRMPCQLCGSGMAFPWTLISKAKIANGSIVEDLQLGIDLAGDGFWPQIEDEIEVVGYFPSSAEGLATQRRRWEHGHIHMILTTVPSIFLMAIKRKSFGLLALAIDIMVPPLALLLMLLVAWFFICALYGFFLEYWIPFLIGASALLLMLASIFLAWICIARHLLTFSEVAKAPWYAVRKIPLYISYLVARQTEWVRTKRD